MNKYIINLHPIFQENSLMLSQRTGIPIVNDFKPKENDLVIAFGGHDKSYELLTLQKQLNYKFGYVIIATEQLNSECYDNKPYIELLKKNIVFPFSFQISKELKLKYEINSHSIYFFDFFTITDTIDFKKRPIDFFFCGIKSNLRESELNKLKLKYPNANIEIDFDYSYTTPLEMMKKLKEVKYVINIPFYENSSMETHRIHRGLSANCKVISLKPHYKYEEEAYDDFVIFVNSLTDFEYDEVAGDTPSSVWEVRNPKGSDEWNQLMEKHGVNVINHNVETLLKI